MDRANQTIQWGRPVSSVDAAKACDVLEHLINAGTLKSILSNYRTMCELLHLKPNVFPLFYPKLKTNLNSWKAKALWKKFDARAGHKCYARGKICPNTRVLIIGAGPCGLRTAIEAQLLGAKVVLVEKRDRISRNNVLHLWPFVIEDLRALGAKKFFGKFCAGAIDHISIRQVQCILLKVALLLGIEIHTEVSFEGLVEPNSIEKIGWRAEFKPTDHPVSQYEFDVIIGADGKRNTLQGFKRKEFRGKLAIAITANFINKRTEAEARVEEISGVAFIFNQKFFKELNVETGIDLENIVYYKDDTHYFVMTAKKLSLIDKGVIKQDYADTARLLSPDNVDRDALMNYAREAADFSTSYQMSDMEFAVNHYGQPDVAMFDFTSMYAAENASKVIERQGYKLLMILVGDSLLEPFWPTGSGCARGFLSSLDACWAIKAWGSDQTTPLEVLAERESIYRLLAQTTPENLNKDCKAYTVDPSTRYPNLNKAALLPQQVLSLYDTDDPTSIELTSRAVQPAAGTELHRKRRRRETHLDPNTLISWIKEQIKEYENDLVVEDLTTSFKDGRVLCAILHHYRPDLLDYSAIKSDDVARNNQLAFDLLEKDIGIPPVMTGDDMDKAEIPDYLTMFSYLTQIYDSFRGEIPHIKHPKLDIPELKESDGIKLDVASNTTTGAMIMRNNTRTKRYADFIPSNKQVTTERKIKKRKSLERHDLCVEERCKRLEEIAANRADRQNKRRHQRRKQTEQFLKSMQMLQMNAKPDSSGPFEDYSLFVYRQTAPHFQDRVKNLEKQFTYVPDRENRVPSQSRGGGAEEQVAATIKDLQDKWRDIAPTEKKPKDLRRAIGKIETSDWNIKEIEKKIMENKMGKSTNKEKERVPKWNREQFLARQTKLEKLDRQASAETKYTELDKGIKHLEQRLKEGSVRDLGQNKVATITEKLVPKSIEPAIKSVQKSMPRASVTLPTQGGCEYCHFCQKRVYLMERLSAEGRFFHRGCFKCQYCDTILRLGSYMFDKEGLYGHRFYCTLHFGMSGELYPIRMEEKIQKEHRKPLEKLKITPLTGVEGVDLLDRVQTPERIEFANLSADHISSDHDESLSQMDEDEWTDRNFGASTAEVCTSDDEDSSSLSGSESDNEDAFEEALDEPPTKEGTLRWMERYKQRYSKERRKVADSDSEDYSSSSDHSSYYENSSGDEEDEPVTEGEEEIRARELRKQEVRVEPPVVQTDTGSDTEIVSDESSPESSSKHNSATEISTDSEFAVDEPTPTREVPSIMFNEFNVTKRRGNYGPPKKVQVKSGILQSPVNGKTQKSGIKLKFTPLVSTPVLAKPAAPTSLLTTRTEGYALNRTQSTGGIATKVSLELKKKYLLGDSGVPGNIQKSGSVSTLDSKFKSFHTNISDCQKLLKPATKISPSMQVFCNKLNEQRSPLSPIISQSSAFSEKDVLKSPDLVNPIGEIIDLTKDSPVVQPDVTKYTKETPNEEEKPFEHELEGRPRSPVREIPIIVPTIDWSRANKTKNSDISCDSLTSDTDSEEHTGIEQSPTVKIFNSIPRVEVHNDAGEILKHDDIALDSLCPYTQLQDNSEKPKNSDECPKSITNEKKSLNQPKTLPGIQKDHVHAEFHTKISPDNCATNTSGHSTSSDHDSYVENTGAAMTETELSDWARDDDFEDVDFDFINVRKHKQPKSVNRSGNVAKACIDDEFDELGHICGREKEFKDLQNKLSFNENLSNVLCSLEFMDTGEETSSDEKILVEATLKNHGYVEFHNEDIMEDSLNPNINDIIETINPEITESATYQKNAGYCIIGNEENFGGKVIDLKENDLNRLKEKQGNDNEEDSLLMVETTTEENTCSDSTVKNVIETVTEKERKDLLNASSIINENKHLLEKIRLDSNKLENVEYQEHCQRLQSKVGFCNVRDSIDVKKSKRKEFSSKPDLIQEEAAVSPVHTVQTPPSAPLIIYTKEEIKKSRDENQKLVQEMVMNKMKAQNRSLERKRRSRNSFSPSLSPSRPFDLAKSATIDLTPQNNDHNVIDDMEKIHCNIYSTPDVLLSTNETPKRQVEKSQTFTGISDLTPTSSIKQHPKSFSKQLSVHSSFLSKHKTNTLPDTPLTNPEAFSLPNIQHALFADQFKTPAEERFGKTKKTTEKLKQDARQRMKLKSNEDLGLSPEDKLKKLRDKMNKRLETENIDVHIQDSIESLVMNTERRNSLLYSNDTLTKRRSNSGKDTYPVRTKSVSEISRSFTDAKLTQINFVDNEDARNKQQFCKSDPNLLTEMTSGKGDKKTKSKDRERRKSITKLISEFFGKKKEGVKNASLSKGFLARISPKSKSKSMINLAGKTAEKTNREIIRTKSFSEVQLRRNESTSPPPIPPLPINYTGSGPSRCTDDSSDGDIDWKRQEQSSCDILDQPGTRRTSRTVHRASRQAHLKRHRMAQEIQRKLEETEVKTRELEQRGVNVEKALRGELDVACGTGDESDLLKEWFDLMRDLTDLRRYERELTVKAQEVELEDQHARLQQELRERLKNEEHKTKDDVKMESSIINEMMEIVAKRDALIVLLEQDRLRYSLEDRDFEEQMLGKGLKMTPLQETPAK